MSDKDTIAFGSARAYRLAEEDENAAHMYQLRASDGPAPYYLPGQDPLDGIEDVAMGQAKGTIQFLWRNHVIQIGDYEWSLDGDLTLWREARIYAAHLRGLGLLISWYTRYGVEYRRRLA